GEQRLRQVIWVEGREAREGEKGTVLEGLEAQSGRGAPAGTGAPRLAQMLGSLRPLLQPGVEHGKTPLDGIISRNSCCGPHRDRSITLGRRTTRTPGRVALNPVDNPAALLLSGGPRGRTRRPSQG